ncbi:MAG TPA: sigma 54-interacting transcriptional regulator [bacterium]|nr:sigma 54-interacting transcriptional regulator [bacterium]
MRISDDPSMKAVECLALTAAACRANVLLEGESGVGKAFIARRIHLASPWARRGFRSLFCVPEGEAGPDVLQLAGELRTLTSKYGTIYVRGVDVLNDIGQRKLLAYLDERDREIQTSVGGHAGFARLIFSSQHHLARQCDQGLFLKQLYLRVSVITIEVPPLRRRTTDIVSLAEHFLGFYARRECKTIRGISPDAQHLLRRMSWEGNIHELKNTINRAVVMADDGQVLSAGILEGVLPRGCT